MAYLNKFLFIGNVGAKPELKEGKKAYISFDIAVSEKKGEADTTNWFRITAFDKLATFCGDYLKKGSQILVEGRVENSKWEDEDKVMQYRTQFLASNIQLLGSRAADSPTADEAAPKKGGRPPKSK